MGEGQADFEWLAGSMRGVLDASPDFVVVKGRDFRILFANATYGRVVGAAPETLVGRLDTELVTPFPNGLPGASADSFRDLDEEVLAGRTPPPTRVSAVIAGVPRLFEIQKSPLRDGAGEVRGIVTYGRDVAAEQQARDHLRVSEARYRLLLEHSPVAMYVHDGQSVLYANPAFAALMGAESPDAMIGYSVLRIADPEDLERLRERVRAVASGKVVSPNAQFRARGVDGRMLHVQVLATRCEYEGKNAIQVVMVDQTATVQARAEREQFEDKLRHGQRLEALGTLASGIAHEFNNTLTVISSNAELALGRLDAAHPSRPFVSEVLEGAGRAGELVRGILAFGRKQSVGRKPVALDELVGQAIRFLRATLPPSVESSVDVRTSAARALVDATQVHQVLLNLCVNSWHAMADARGRVVITVERVEVDDSIGRVHPDLRAGSWVCLDVEDDGRGMDASTLSKAFDPFFTTKPVGEGTGLGLSVVHGIMREHEGAVTIESTPGKGTRVRLWFPAASQEVSPGTPERASVTRPAERHVLLVEDEPVVLKVTARMLTALGYRVTARGSFQEGRAALEGGASDFDVLVTDQSLPDGTGFELARVAKELSADVPILLVTGRPDEETRRAAKGAGVHAVVGKPYTGDVLVEAIELAVRARGS